MLKRIILLAFGPLFLCVSLGQAQTPPPDAPDFKVRVLYTGKLLGYFRQELSKEQQDCLTREKGNVSSRSCSRLELRAQLMGEPQRNLSLQRACDRIQGIIDQTHEPPEMGALGRVVAFWCTEESEKTPDPRDTILLGMGDNLAPELGSRLRRYYWDGNLFHPTDFDDCRGLLPGKAFQLPFPKCAKNQKKGSPCEELAVVDQICGTSRRMTFAAEDNVANFLLLSGYQATVPGREDFLYGALWLKDLAARLSELAERDSTVDTVRFLAANLRVAPVQQPLKPLQWVNPLQDIKQPCPLFFSQDLYTRLPVAGCSRDAAAVDSDEQKNVGYTELHVTDPMGVRGTIQVIALVDGGSASSGSSGNSDLLREVSKDRKQFWDGDHKTQYEVFVTKPDQELQNILAKTEEKDYALRILLAQMPRSNAFQLASHYGRTHQACIVVNGGAEQVIPFEDSNHPAEKCKGMRTFTLPAVDLVIAEAQDGLETGDEDATYFQDRDKKHARAQVVAPHSAYPVDPLKDPDKFNPETTEKSDHTDLLINPLSSVTFRRTMTGNNLQDPERTVKVTYGNRVPDFVSDELWHAQNMPSPFSISSPPSGDLVACGLKNANQLAVSPTPDEAFEFCALRSLQREAKASVAMLQRRDFFFPNVLKQDDDSERSVCASAAIPADCLKAIMFAHFLWKDDTPALINLTGAQLKAVLSQSNALHQNDETSEVKDVDQEWLVTTGIVQAQKKAGTGGGSSADGSGDLTPDDLCRDAAADEASGLTKIGIQLAGQGKADGGKNSGTYCINGAPIDDAQLYKVITSQALAGNEQVYPGISKLPPGKPALDDEDNVATLFGPTLGRAIQRNWLPAAATCAPDCLKSLQRLEKSQQQRRVFHLSVQNAEISYSAYTPNLSDTSLLNTFGGVTDSRASSPSSQSVVATNSLRALEEGHSLDWGMLETLDFNFSQTGNQQGGYPTVSFATNSFVIGPLAQVHLGDDYFGHPWKGLPAFKLTISPVLYQLQPRGNVFAFNLDNAFANLIPNQARFAARRQWGLANRTGLRHEFNDGGAHKPDKGSYYEFGLEHNTYSNVLFELDFANAGGVTTPCPLAPDNTYTQCVKAAQKGAAKNTVILGPGTQIQGHYTNLHTSGLYFDSILSKQLTRLKLPANQPLSILFQGKGDYAFRHSYADQYTTQAYYAFTSSIGLQIPIYGNLSVVPSYGAFFYENFNQFHSLIAKTATIDVRWTFDHHDPVRWPSDLSYTTPPSNAAGASTASSNTGSAQGPKRGK
ncbi:MAG TPA: hypothetical protein VNZ56_14390 [Verrucomicrobiae bacterium]|jgi:hypothetical protein|nr:hypothetical protein [Verrucomicrobiae bacterium]